MGPQQENTVSPRLLVALSTRKSQSMLVWVPTLGIARHSVRPSIQRGFISSIVEQSQKDVKFEVQISIFYSIQLFGHFCTIIF
jgi:hypothetical protein